MLSCVRLLQAAMLSLPMFAGYANAAEPWSGAYVGFHNGGAWGDSDWTLSNGSSASPNPDAGALFGGHAGILGQWGVLVAGVEVSYSGLPNVDGNTWCPAGTASCRTEIENLLLLNGRLGFELGRAMLYGTGGWARSTVNVTRTAAVAAQDDGHLSGWDIGGGIEFIMWPNVVFGVEYLHVDYDDGGFGLANGGVLVENISVEPDLDVVRARFTVQLNREREVPAYLK